MRISLDVAPDQHSVNQGDANTGEHRRLGECPQRFLKAPEILDRIQRNRCRAAHDHSGGDATPKEREAQTNHGPMMTPPTNHPRNRSVRGIGDDVVRLKRPKIAPTTAP